MKRVLAFWTVIILLTGLMPVLAEEDTVSEQELSELLALEAEEEDGPVSVMGRIYSEPDCGNFDLNSPALYTARLEPETSILAERDQRGPKVCYNTQSVRCDVLYVGLVWVIVRVDENIGYVKRQRLIYTSIQPADPEYTPPFGFQIHQYIAVTKKECALRKSMSDEDESYVILKPGTHLSIWKILDGWAIVTYWRNYAYINMNDLTDLIPVSPTDLPMSGDTPIAAYTSYYKMLQTESNINRIFNIGHGAELVSGTIVPGGRFNFNKDIGPFNRTGFKQAPVLVNGTAKPGYGGGTCQVSSTLYNCLITLPGITILQRRPHGAEGASYLPIFCDAAVGNDNLNLRFRNDYDFTIRIEGYSQGDGALLFVIYRD